MAPDRWQEVDRAFQCAVELDVPERSEFLSAVSSSDAELAEQVGLLMRSLDSRRVAGEDYLELSAIEHFGAEAAAPEPPARIGAWRIVRLIGQGGMGAVYLAVRDDDAYRKEAAIKLIRFGLDSASIVRRFRRERQILASLDHPNVARLLDAGAAEDGAPYLVMEYIAGR